MGFYCHLTLSFILQTADDFVKANDHVEFSEYLNLKPYLTNDCRVSFRLFFHFSHVNPTQICNIYSDNVFNMAFTSFKWLSFASQWDCGFFCRIKVQVPWIACGL